ncbi:MAG TPA: [protein-PII] uridylyltransferase [Gammaproteobacteria bacterium]|nr:[protein-PII] uridylyltransferase [Gammaproteobacteria bacterium]
MALFSPTALDAALEKGASPLAVFRETLREAATRQGEQFLAGTPVTELVRDRARLVDELLRRAWDHCFPQQQTGCALVAVGGYGRGELHPASDIDLLILLAPDGEARYREAIEQFLMFLWDMGLEVGHSVRTVDECIHQAAADITVITNLMESRLLRGDRLLYEQMLERTGPDAMWPVDAFFAAKREEQEQRHHKYHDTAYNLEPNVKEGPGGLRDIQIIAWVAKRHFGSATLGDLVEHGFLTKDEYLELSQGQEFLWRVRYALHLLSGRGENRLLFDYQTTIAGQFGYRDDGRQLAVEQFMRDYYRTITELSRLNEMLLQLFQEAILYRDKPVRQSPLNKRFRVCNDFIEVTDDQVFRRYPFALLEIFLLLEQHPEIQGVRASTIRLIRAHRHLIDDDFRNDLRCRSLFMEILRQPRGITHELRRMNRYGILAAYFPAFADIVGRMQYDLFHVYTVDDHILMVLRNVRRFTVPEFAGEFPLCSEIIRTIPKLEVLYLAALFHDIAKGRGGDHSELGAEDAAAFCRHHGLSEFDTALVSWLVRHHLLMSVTAQHKDTSDPDVVNEFARLMGDQLHLDHLYLLTVADIRGTNPALWNSWKDSLLKDLYQRTRAMLRRGLDLPVDKALFIQRHQEAALALLPEGRHERARTLWADLDEDYFMRHSPDEIAWHSEAILDAGENDLPLVVIREETQRGGTEIFIYARDDDHLFAKTVMALDRMGLDIVDARIITTRSGYTLDTYIVLDASGRPIRARDQLQDILAGLRRQLEARLEDMQISRRPARQLRHFSITPRLTFSCDSHNRYTIAELVAADRPGLLAQVGRAFVECGVRVHNARIATLGERVEDVFYITDRNNQPLKEEAHFQRLRSTIIRHLEEKP